LIPHKKTNSQSPDWLFVFEQDLTGMFAAAFGKIPDFWNNRVEVL
jgi:hypothetical protein